MLRFFSQHFSTNFYQKISFYVIGSILGSMWYHNPQQLQLTWSNSVGFPADAILRIQLNKSSTVGLVLVASEFALLAYMWHNNAMAKEKYMLCQKIEDIIQQPQDIAKIRSIINGKPIKADAAIKSDGENLNMQPQCSKKLCNTTTPSFTALTGVYISDYGVNYDSDSDI